MSARRAARRPPRVLMLAPEAVPFRGEGGRAQAIGALADRLHRGGVEVTLALPAPAAGRRERSAATLEVVAGGSSFAVTVEALTADSGLPVRVFAAPELEPDPAAPAVAWGLFCAAALRWAARAEPPYDVLHLHDWETAVAAVLLRAGGGEGPGAERPAARALLTVHDAGAAGRAPRTLFGRLGLPTGLLHPQLLEHHGEPSLLKGGLVFADLLTTPAPRARRLPARAGDLEPLLRERAADLHGVVQGIAAEGWDPASDPALAAGFSAADPRGKAACKAALQAELGLPERRRVPLLAFIGSEHAASGLEQLLEVVAGLRRRDLQLAVLWRGSAALAERVLALAAEAPGKVALAAAGEGQERRLLAGCDLLVVAPGADPRGDLARRALRYGALPLLDPDAALAAGVRAVTPRAVAAGRANGFLRRTPQPEALRRALSRALGAYRDAAGWRRLVDSALAALDPWPACVRRYRALYRAATARPPRRIAVPAATAVAAPPETEAPGEPATPYIDWGPELPRRYGEDALGLLVQSPRSLYAYWEVAPATRAAAGDAPLRLMLREDRAARELGAVEEVGEWWIAAEPRRRYEVEIATADGRVLLRGAAVETPADAPAPAAPGAEVRWVHRGRYASGSPPGAEPLYHYGAEGPVGRFGPSAWQEAAAAAARAGEEFLGSSEAMPGKERA